MLAAAVLVSLADAVTTYLLVAWGLGYEANPLLAFVNDAPETSFLVQGLSALLAAASVKFFEASAAALPAPRRRRLFKVYRAAFAAAIAWRAAVVLNNVLGLAAGWTPLADLF